MNTLKSQCSTRWTYNFKAISCFLESIEIFRRMKDQLRGQNQNTRAEWLPLMLFDFDENHIPIMVLRMLLDIFQNFYYTTLALEKDNSRYGDIRKALFDLRELIGLSNIYDPLKKEIYDIVDEVCSNYINNDLVNLCAFANDVNKYLHDEVVCQSATSGLEALIQDHYNKNDILNQWKNFLENPPDNLELSPLDFWRSQEQSRELSKIILSIIQIPSSTASVERSFSIQKYIHSLNRNRLLHKHVREEMIIK